jgi:uncharacterized protein YwqG
LPRGVLLESEGEALPARVVEGWDRGYPDYPHNEETVIADLGLDDDERDAYIDLSCEIPGGDKLFGWPDFVQGVEYEYCTKCRNEMMFLLQLDSECNVPIMWGDTGTAMVFYCAKHPDVITFNWACC